MGKPIITGKNVGIGKQNYAALRENECFMSTRPVL